MALNREELIQLARANAKASVSPSHNFSYAGETLSAEALNTKFVQELNELGRTPHDFEDNATLIYRLMEESITEVLPPMVMQKYGQFAEIKTYGQGDKPVFKVRISEASKRRAKQFVTRVALAGRYEVFKLDGYSFEVNTSAFGGAARVEWEEMLDGRFTMNDYYSLVLEAMDEYVYKEIAKSLIATVKDIKAVNKVASAGFDENEMDRLLQTADTYGQSTIYCTFEFAARMLPSDEWRYSDNMKDQLWNNGAFTRYKNHNVVILPQTFEDETNEKKVIDPRFAWIIPTGTEKPVKIAFEGSAQVKAFDNNFDWSKEIHTYHKMGVATYLVNPGLCVYENTDLSIDNIPGPQDFIFD